MPRKKRELTWNAGVNQWCKQINGKRKYFGKGKSKSNKEDYQNALSVYHGYLEELDKNPAVITQTPTEILQEKAVKTGKKIPKTRRYAVHQLKNCVNRWIEAKMRQVTSMEGKVSSSGGITLGRVKQLEGNISHFVTFYGARKQLKKIRPIDLTNYANKQVGLMHEGEIKQNTVYQRFATLKTFLKYCWTEEIIDVLPRNIDSVLKMGIERKAPEIDDIFNWKNGEIQELYGACARYSKEMELWFLLATNCGFLVKEMSDLQMKDCLWKKRGWTKVIRPRLKTGVVSEHTLWNRTEELWKELAVGRYGTSDICFTRESGEPLSTYKKGHSNSLIGTKIKTLIRKTFGENDNRSIRSLRKTGASYIGARFAGVDSLYLAHKPVTIAGMHYTMASWKKLHEALSYMEKDFGISKHLFKRHLQKPAQRKKGTK